MTNWLPAKALPDLVGFEATDLDRLEPVIRDTLSFGESPQIELATSKGVDARGGITRLDIVGVADDSVGGYRIELTIDFLKDDTATDILGLRIVSVRGRAICTRGVSSDNKLCVWTPSCYHCS